VLRGRKPNLERRLHVAALRFQGLTFAQIGQRLGISRQRAQRLFPRQERRCSACGAVIACRRALPHRLVAILCLVCLQQSPDGTLTQRLRVLRLAAGLSQRRLARSARIAHYTVFQAESGKASPRPATVKRLARALRTTVAVLTGEKRLAVTTEPTRNGKFQRCRSAKPSSVSRIIPASSAATVPG
jgi:transcriptional regulator with XRE-family HTH domain